MSRLYDLMKNIRFHELCDEEEEKTISFWSGFDFFSWKSMTGIGMTGLLTATLVMYMKYKRR